ncbi:sperm-associated antigen 16 protein-like isoform X1 [Biomphalaria glabrata]|uniref:Sperm-associated antigen 16 protein-like isoform X1 n=1 Tax=Biomphalaria glabrata TaxID=6526 RepID=A0A9U8EH32_BIOGL|nr:sperm-associated antigen 16 protein-like isoform X1 [Biomphalaria glabrata]
MAVNMDSEKYYIEKEEVTVDSDDDFKYEEVPIDDDFIPPDLEEDLDLAVRTIHEANEDAIAKASGQVVVKSAVHQKPEVVDDFVRNFLIHMGMWRTLDSFQTEWYELQERGQLKYADIGIVPDVYTRNQELENEIEFQQKEVIKYKDAAIKAKDLYVKLRKERDFHRMHHKRVVQEKNKLIDDIKRLKHHYSQYPQNLEALKVRYEAAMKEKMMANLEKDRALGQVIGLQSTIQNLEAFQGNVIAKTEIIKTMKGPTHKQLLMERQKKSEFASGDVNNQPSDFKRYPNDSDFPVDQGVNPMLNQIKGTLGQAARASGFRLSNSITAHSHAISGETLSFQSHILLSSNTGLPITGVSLHPRKQILATASDDHTWKIWAIPSGEIIMTGEGHSDWLSDCQFHPLGSSIATTSGDSTVKIWDFSKAACVHTFTDHTAAVWSCSWHTCGHFLASSSMDNTAKVWDLNSLRCRYTLRGHVDSVNTVEFLPYSNTLLTSSADKTLSLWDARTGLCAQTYYGHLHSVNHATFNVRGDTIGSCDAYGVVKLWDVRSVAPMASFEVGPHSANKLGFDITCGMVAIASNDSTIKLYEILSGMITSLAGHEDSVLCLLFDSSGDFMVSGGSDNTIRIWS